MSTTDPATHTFVCPVCSESMSVSDAMQAALVEHGCVVCGSAVPLTAFR
ncbi:MAG: hypothetical protein ABEJ82_01815 [Haloplanus sp.]